MKYRLIFAALVASATSAVAADLPSRKAAPAYVAPVVAPVLSWTGAYIGVNAGGTWSDAKNADGLTASFVNNIIPNTEALLASGRVKTENGGFIGGGQIGYNHQFSSNLLLGLEADIQGLASSGQNGVTTNAVTLSAFGLTAGNTTTLSATKSLDYFGTVRGRIGYLVTPSLLVYGAGGLAYGGANFSGGHFGVTSAAGLGLAISYLNTASANYSDTRVGWTAGGGVEWMFARNWSAKAEYLYYDLGRVSVTAPVVYAPINFAATPFVNGASQWSTHFNGHVVRAGLNYHFDWSPASVVAAKY